MESSGVENDVSLPAVRDGCWRKNLDFNQIFPQNGFAKTDSSPIRHQNKAIFGRF